MHDGQYREGAADTLHGGDGNDGLHSENKPASKDVLYCDDGDDLAVVDKADVLHDCEQVNRY